MVTKDTPDQIWKETVQTWQKELTRRIGVVPTAWRGRNPSVDVLIGILREMEDGEDPFADERKASASMSIDRLIQSHPTYRDGRDAEFNKMIAGGGWMWPPGHGLRYLVTEDDSVQTEENDAMWRKWHEGLADRQWAAFQPVRDLVARVEKDRAQSGPNLRLVQSPKR